MPDSRCVFCNELETVNHLFLECVVAKQIWLVFEECFNHTVSCYENAASRWLCNKKFGVVNIFSSAFIWDLWKVRNNFVFQGAVWRDMSCIWNKILPMVKQWRVLCPELQCQVFDEKISKLVEVARRCGRITGF